MAKDPAAVAAKWSNNLSNASDSIRAGVQQVTVAPGQAAAAQQAKMRARLIQAIDSGKWAQNVSAVSLASWKDRMLTVGLQNVSNGARNAQPKMQAFLTQFLPYAANVSAQVRAMPGVTDADMEARMIANKRLMQQFKKGK